MSSSLQDLLNQEGFRRRRRNPPAHSPVSDQGTSSPSISLCRDRRSVELIAPLRSPSAVSSVVAVLSGYIHRFTVDPIFRENLKERCVSSLTSDADATQLVNLETGIDAIERLAASPPSSRETRIRSLRSSIRVLSLVAASLNSPKSKNGYYYYYYNTRCIPNSHLSACAQLYLSVVYKIDGNDKISARHLLQAFCDAPRLARRSLAPELWEQFFLPHLLHLKLWFQTETEMLSNLHSDDKEQTTRNLHRVFNDQIDLSTAQFAAYFKDYIKADGKSDVLPPVVQPPPRSSYLLPSGDSSLSVSLQAPPQRKSYSFRLFTCRNEAHDGGVRRSQVARTEQLTETSEGTTGGVVLINLTRAITLICSSDSLSECETAVRVIANSWLDSPAVEMALSKVSVIEGLLEVSFTSKDEEVLELAISVLGSLVATSEVNRQVVLNADPQLEILLRLLGSSNSTLFLKAACLVHLLKPKAKQMLSADWVPLTLRILENGNLPQALFSVQGCPKSAAFYLLDQLLTGFDVDRNVENAKQVVALGGLNLLSSRLDLGDSRERKKAASLLATCVRADGACREHLAATIRKESILELLISKGQSLSLLVELLCLQRRSNITRFLLELQNQGELNAMHVLLVCLHQATPEQRPLLACILLHLDLLGDPSRFSVYREEAIDALVLSMDCSSSKKVQERCCKALLMLAGRFSSTGQPSSEAWLLKRAGLDDCPPDLYTSKEILAVVDELIRPDEEENVIEDWLTRLATILLTRGGHRFLVALSDCVADATSGLARACLVTVAWMSSSLSLLENVNGLWSMACSDLLPRLLDCLQHHRALEERVLACLALLNFARTPECLTRLLPMSGGTEALLQDLTRFTWTAKEILFLVAADPSMLVGLQL